jgi:hypothetical protein
MALANFFSGLFNFRRQSVAEPAQHEYQRNLMTKRKSNATRLKVGM